MPQDSRPEPAVVARVGAPGGTVVVVTAEVGGDAVRIGLAGEIDASNAACLSEALSKLDTGHAGICIDMSRLTFVDCTGLAMLRALQRPDGDAESVRLEGIAHPTVRRIVELADAMEQITRH